MNIKELKDLWKEHGFRPVKRLGQNFLIDKNVRDNILNALPLDKESIVVEVGAGFGVMSFEIAKRVKQVYAIEKDEKICEIMEPLFRKKENIRLVRGDILETDICSFASGSSRVILFGNIPYYITTPVIEKIIKERLCISGAYIVVQNEVARRVVSSPGSKDYGSLSCFVQFYTKTEKTSRIKKNSFYPRPLVDSCLLKLEILSQPGVKVRDKELMFKIIRKAFLQRRKKVLNSLSHGEFLSMDRDKWQDILTRSGIDLSSRAENLALSDYARISDEIGSC